MRLPPLHLHQPEGTDDAVEPALGIARLGLDRHRLAEQVGGLDVEVVGGQPDGEGEARADLVETDQPGEGELRTGLGVEDDRTIFGQRESLALEAARPRECASRPSIAQAVGRGTRPTAPAGCA